MTHLLLILIYLAFISLGLPDSMLGAAWPTMYPELGAPVSYAGIIAMMISFCTIISSLFSHKFTRWLGTGKVTAISSALTATALMGFSFSTKLWQLCLWTIPYGIGAGGVDAAINNYVATHYKSHHMSWLHCMWGLGATIGPTIMGRALTGGFSWNSGYRWVSFIQIGFTLVLFASLGLWRSKQAPEDVPSKSLTIREILAIPGVKATMLCFFCYCSVENTSGLWVASYLTLHKGVAADLSASFASMFYIGLTIGRAISGFISMKLNDSQMIWLGTGVIALGIAAMLLPFGEGIALMGFILVGLGCAPIYPCIIHTIPAMFGADRSQAIIGVMMAGAYVGGCFMPPLFGLIANHISMALLPLFLTILLSVMAVMRRLLDKLVMGQN